MRAFRPRPAPCAGVTALAALAALAAAAAPFASPAAAGDPPPSRGVMAPAPAEAYDTLRYVRPDATPAPAPAPRRGCVPLLLDSNDLGFGSSVVFDHLPSVRELGDLSELTSVRHVVVSLAEWPGGYEQLQVFAQAILPEDCDLVVVLSGYPPSHSASEAWNYLRLPLRIVLVVDGPPSNRAGIDELNRIRGLERVIADMQYPSRSGFERLQRPLSFRVLR